MIDYEEKINSNQLENTISRFESLDDSEKLEMIKTIIEKMENGEIEIGGQTIYPSEIGIDDGFACCRAILRILKKYANVEKQS